MSGKWTIAAFILVVIAAAWWGIVNYAPQPAQQAQAQPLPPTDTHYKAPAPLAVNHSTASGANVYSGTLPLRSCNVLSGGLATLGGSPVHLTLTFTVFDADGTCLASTAAEDASQPFSMSFSSKTSTLTPVLDSVTVNGASVPFTIVEGK